MADANEIGGSGRGCALDVLRFQTPLAGHGFKRHGFAFIQGLVPPAEDGGVVDEDILPGVLDNEAKPFFVVKPLHFAACHNFPDLRGRPKANRDTTVVRGVALLLSQNGHASSLYLF